MIFENIQVVGGTATPATNFASKRPVFKGLSIRPTTLSVVGVVVAQGAVSESRDADVGYRLKRLVSKTRTWKLQYETLTGGDRRCRDVPEHELRSLGLVPSMSFEDAKRRKDELNTLGKIDRRETRVNAIRERLEADAAHPLRYMPQCDIDEFCALYGGSKKFDTLWRKTRAVLRDVDLDIEDWGSHQDHFYKAFLSHNMSTSYVEKVRHLINRWGRFQARKYRKPFEPLGAPKGQERERINDRFFDKAPEGFASAPLTPEMLESSKSSLKPAQYRWLFLSVWFGLRPSEVNAVSQGTNFQIQRHGKVTVLAVYQPKLSALPRAERWKLIPCTCEQQFVALDFIREIKSAPISSPLRKTVKDRFGVRVKLYGGRKGFADLMLDKGHTLEDIASWLGHRSIERTWATYKSRTRLRLSKAS